MDRSFRTAFAVTPTDNVELRKGFITDAIRCSGAGNLNVRMEDGKDAVIPFLAGETQHIAVTIVHSASTTATGITAYKY